MINFAFFERTSILTFTSDALLRRIRRLPPMRSPLAHRERELVRSVPSLVAVVRGRRESPKCRAFPSDSQPLPIALPPGALHPCLRTACPCHWYFLHAPDYRSASVPEPHAIMSSAVRDAPARRFRSPREVEQHCQPGCTETSGFLRRSSCPETSAPWPLRVP